MKLIQTVTVIALAAAMPAFAGSPATPDINVIAPTSESLDADRWAGFYLGGYIGSAYDDTETMYGLQAGYNWQRGLFVFGAELDAFSVEQTGDYEVFLNARAGVAIGNNALVFVKAGQGQYRGTTDLYGVGLGAEYAVSDSISIRVDYELHNAGAFSNVLDGPGFAKIGVSWGF